MASYSCISNYPANVTWLSDTERSYLKARLKADSDATNYEQFTWSQVAMACKDIKCWLYGLCYFTISLPLYTLSLFLVCIMEPKLFVLLTGGLVKQVFCFSFPFYILLTRYLAHDHQRHGLYLCKVPASHHPTVRLCYTLHHILGRSI